MPRKRLVTAAAAAALVLGATSAASAATVSPDVKAAPAAATAADPCGYTPAVPADRFKGIPPSTRREAAQPYTRDTAPRRGSSPSRR